MKPLMVVLMCVAGGIAIGISTDSFLDFALDALGGLVIGEAALMASTLRQPQ